MDRSGSLNAIRWVEPAASAASAFLLHTEVNSSCIPHKSGTYSMPEGVDADEEAQL